MSHQDSSEIVLVPSHITSYTNTPDVVRVEVGRFKLTGHKILPKTSGKAYMGVIVYYMNEPVQYHFAGRVENNVCTIELDMDEFDEMKGYIAISFLTYLKGFRDNFTRMRNVGKNFIQPDLVVRIAMLEQQLIAKAVVKNPNYLEAFEDWQYDYELEGEASWDDDEDFYEEDLPYTEDDIDTSAFDRYFDDLGDDDFDYS